MQMNTEEKTVTSIDEYLELILSYQTSDNNLQKFLFRGQPKQFDTLYPSLFRDNKDAANETINIIEKLNFYHNDFSIDHTDTIANLLIELQQKGEKTRLLDVTSSPLIALYNAIKDEKNIDGKSKFENNDGVVYILEDGKNFFSEMGIGNGHNLYIKAKAVALLKNMYLKLVCCLEHMDIIHALLDCIGSIAHLEKIIYIGKTTSVMHEHFPFVKNFNHFEKILEQKLFIKDTSGSFGIHKVFAYLFGLPIHLNPHKNSYEQLVSNRIMSQQSSFLLFPNKVINSYIIHKRNDNKECYTFDNYDHNGKKETIELKLKTGLTNSKKDELLSLTQNKQEFIPYDKLESFFDDIPERVKNYCSVNATWGKNPIKIIIIPANKKQELRGKIELIYNEHVFYPEHMGNKY